MRICFAILLAGVLGTAIYVLHQYKAHNRVTIARLCPYLLAFALFFGAGLAVNRVNVADVDRGILERGVPFVYYHDCVVCNEGGNQYYLDKVFYDLIICTTVAAALAWGTVTAIRRAVRHREREYDDIELAAEEEHFW